MKRKFIPAEESFSRWPKDPQFLDAYQSLEKEFAAASAMTMVRGQADVTQEQVVKAIAASKRSPRGASR